MISSCRSSTEHLFNLKFAVKDLERQSKKCEKQEKQEKAKAKKAIAAGNVDVARIHAENAIRQKNQKVNYLRMSARVDAVASRVQSALTTRNVSEHSPQVQPVALIVCFTWILSLRFR